MFRIGGRAHTIDEIIQVAEQGYPFAEINLDDPDKIRSDMNRLLEIKKDYGLYYLAHLPNEGNPIDLEKLQTRFVPKIEQLLALCPELAITEATLHFWMDKRWDWATEEIISGKLAMLSRLVAEAGKFGVTLCLENLSGAYDSFIRYFKEIPDLKMTMDIGHGQLLNSENTAWGFMENLFDKIAHIHVHDNHGGDSITDDLHLPLGEGIIDYPAILSQLKKKGYQSTMTMEVGPEYLKKTEAVIQQFMN